MNTPPPAGTKARIGRPSEAIFPSYAKNVIGQRLEEKPGKKVGWHMELVEYPDLDRFQRFFLKFDGMNAMSDEAKSAVGRILSWYLPYPLFV